MAPAILSANCDTGKAAKVLCAGSISVTSCFTKSKIWIQLPDVVYALFPFMRTDVADPACTVFMNGAMIGPKAGDGLDSGRSGEQTSELQAPFKSVFRLFFFNDTATTEIYTLSLHDALPISDVADPACTVFMNGAMIGPKAADGLNSDRSEEHTSELQSPCNLVCRLLLE